MAVFIGDFTYSIDSKGRINIPAKFRQNLSPEANGTFVLTPGFETCISVYPLDEWKKTEDRLKRLNPFKEKHRKFIRLMLSNVAEFQMDRQGRIPIPPELIKFAMLDKEVRIIGMLNRFEIWNPKVYEQYQAESQKNFEELAEEIMSDSE